MIRECKTMVTHLSCKKGTEQGVVAPEASFFVKNHATTMATLGAISPLVAILDSSSSTFCTHAAIAALLSLAAGNDLNNPDSERSLLACFTLDRNRTLIGASGAIPPLIHILRNGRDPQIQSKALELFYSLSLTQCNVKTLVRTGATSVILHLVKNPRHSKKAFAVLATEVAIPLGLKATMTLKDGVATLVKDNAWGANPKCQESAVHLLMVMAPHSYGYRQAMVRKRAIPALLELSLLGSAVAQKRAVRVLGFLRDDREQGRAEWYPRKAKQQQFMIYTESSHDMFGNGRNESPVNVMVKSLEHQNLQWIVRLHKFPTNKRRRSLSLAGCETASHAL